MTDSIPPVVVWLLGPTAAGKTTLAEALTRRLQGRAQPTIHFDGDEVRDWFGADLGFAAEDRLRVVRTLVHLANKSRAAGLNVVVSALTANADARALVEDSIDDLIQIFVTCSPETCAARDPKGLYAQARQGEIDTLIGAEGDYPAPAHPHVVLDTDTATVDDLIGVVEDFLIARGYLAVPGEQPSIARSGT